MNLNTLQNRSSMLFYQFENISSFYIQIVQLRFTGLGKIITLE